MFYTHILLSSEQVKCVWECDLFFYVLIYGHFSYLYCPISFSFYFIGLYIIIFGSPLELVQLFLLYNMFMQVSLADFLFCKQVDMFMDVSFDAVRIDIRFFQIKILALNSEVVCNKSSLPAAERTIHSLCQHCEASLQLLQSLCQQKIFRERLLKNKVLLLFYFCAVYYIICCIISWS